MTTEQETWLRELDKSEKAQRLRGRIGRNVIYVLAGAMTGILILVFRNRLAPPVIYLLLAVFPIIVLTFHFSIVIHELGHAVLGRMAGFRLLRFVAGPLMLQPEAGKWRLRRSTGLAQALGMVIMVPRGTQNLRRRYAWMTAGGVLFNLIFGLMGLWLYMSQSDLHIDTLYLNFLGAVTGLFLAGYSLIFIYSNVRPRNVGGYVNDGMRILNLVRHKPAAEMDLCLMCAFAELMAGKRPAELDPAPLEKAAELGGVSPLRVELQRMLAAIYEDRGEIEVALHHEQARRKLVRKVAPVFRGFHLLEIAWFAARHEKDISFATACFERVRPNAMLPNAQISLVAAALALGRGENQQAVELAEKAIQELDLVVESGTRASFQSAAEKLIREANSNA